MISSEIFRDSRIYITIIMKDYPGGHVLKVRISYIFIIPDF